MGKVHWLKRLREWGLRHPAAAAMLVILLVYLVYLPTTDYRKQFHDAENYWVYAKQYVATGAFSFLAYENYQRGYFFPLLLSPFTLLSDTWGWGPLAVPRVLGAVVAAVVYGWAGPALWQAVRGGGPVSVARRLVFAAFGFALWRDYFNFTLTDFPALLALGAALWALVRRPGLGGALLGGVALAVAVNLRPVYQASIPAVLLLALVPAAGRARWWGAARAAVLLVGAALVLLPQAYSNSFHAGSPSPWVLTTPPGQPNLFLQQLGWGLAMQKYETNIGGDYALAQMRFEDPRGQALLESTGLDQFTKAGQYLSMCLGQPLQAVGVFTRHLFNGLDVQYPTPYVREVFVPTWPVAWLNYSLVWGGLLVLLIHGWQRPAGGWARAGLVLLSLLLPCLAVLPTAIECRFLLPLHLLLSAAVAFGMAPQKWWRAASAKARWACAVSYVAILMGGFSASASAQRHLAATPRLILHDLPLQFLKPTPAPEPW